MARSTKKKPAATEPRQDLMAKLWTLLGQRRHPGASLRETFGSPWPGVGGATAEAIPGGTIDHNDVLGRCVRRIGSLRLPGNGGLVYSLDLDNLSEEQATAVLAALGIRLDGEVV